MSRRTRTPFGAATALAAFALLAGCGQRGPLTLPESARPIQRLDKAAAPAPTSPPASGAQGSGAPAEAAPQGAPPRPEDDEPEKR